jgi:hypothetical protein
VGALRAYNSPRPLSTLTDEHVDEYKLALESIVIIRAWVLNYHVPEYNLNIIPVSIFLLFLLVLKSEFFG